MRMPALGPWWMEDVAVGAGGDWVAHSVSMKFTMNFNAARAAGRAPTGKVRRKVRKVLAHEGMRRSCSTVERFPRWFRAM